MCSDSASPSARDLRVFSVAIPLEDGGAGIAGVDIKLGSIGESMASGGFRRKLRLLLEETAFGEGIAEGP